MAHMVTADVYFGLQALVDDPTNVAMNLAEAYHALLMADGGVRAVRAGINPADVQGPLLVDDAAPPVHARVEQGRWLGDCECGGAMLLIKGAPFMCGSCFNAANGHRYRPVMWPDDITAIEDVLLARPEPGTRGWAPVDVVVGGNTRAVAQTLDELVTENDDHAVGVPQSVVVEAAALDATAADHLIASDVSTAIETAPPAASTPSADPVPTDAPVVQ